MTRALCGLGERAGGRVARADRAPCSRQWVGVGLTAGVLLLGGIAQRLTAAWLAAETDEKIRLPRPLSELPLVIGAWEGTDVPLTEGVQKIAGNDDYVNRTYRHCETGEVVSLYVAYTARPRTMLRHRPTVCYPSAGWSYVETRALTLQTPVDVHGIVRTLPAQVHLFVKPGMMDEARLLVLNYYVLSGRPTADESSFTGLSWRTPNLMQDATRYVAQVQIATSLASRVDTADELVRGFAERSAADVLAFLPAPDPEAEN
jgi:EpsI family protein